MMRGGGVLLGMLVLSLTVMAHDNNVRSLIIKKEQ
jgi:hypothetical protein